MRPAKGRAGRLCHHEPSHACDVHAHAAALSLVRWQILPAEVQLLAEHAVWPPQCRHIQAQGNPVTAAAVLSTVECHGAQLPVLGRLPQMFRTAQSAASEHTHTSTEGRCSNCSWGCL